MLFTGHRAACAACAAFAAMVFASLVNYTATDSTATAAPPHDHSGHSHSTPLQGVPVDQPERGLIYGGLTAVQDGPCLGAYSWVTPSAR